MGAINGSDFIKRLDQLDTEIWLDGKKVQGKISQHPAFKGVLRTKASLYNMQHEAEFKDKLTFHSPETGDSIGLSFLQPKTKDDLKKDERLVRSGLNKRVD